MNKDKIIQQVFLLKEKNKELEKQIVELEKSVKNSQIIPNEENTISYQLGYSLIHSIESFSNFLSLPNVLYKLYKENQSRKKNKENIVNSLVTKKVNRSAVQRNKNLNQGLILLDPISELCWKDAFSGFSLVRDNYEHQIETTKSQFAFFESAWKANKGSWIYAFNSPNLKHPNAQALIDAINLLKKKKIPIIFWNKEDPMHYEMFKPIASMVDYIFTTDELIVEKYKKELKNNNVWALPFAAPVKRANPIGRFQLPEETVCFAGTYYRENHLDRKKQMDILLPVLLDNQGVIYDRASKDNSGKYEYPKEYLSIIRDGIEFEEMLKVYKTFKVFLNVNTITQSTTMMSRRVYELLVSGTPVVSTPSKAITEQFSGIVLTVRNTKEANLAVQKLLKDSYFWHKQSVLGIRTVLAKHTYENRWKYIQNKILDNNIDRDLDLDNVKIRIIAKYHGYQDLNKYIESLLRQKDVEVAEIVILKSSKLDLKYKHDIVSIVNISDFNVKQYIREYIDDYTYFTQDTIYNYKKSLIGMLLTFKYSNTSGIVRKQYYKYSNLIENFDFSINQPNWYTTISEVGLGSFLMKNNGLNKFEIDINKGIVKSKEKELFLIDPFNILFLDDRSASLKDINDLIYKSISKLGI